MLKKAGVVAATAAGLVMLGAPAFAATATPQHAVPQDDDHVTKIEHNRIDHNREVTQIGTANVNAGDINTVTCSIASDITATGAPILGDLLGINAQKCGVDED